MASVPPNSANPKDYMKHMDDMMENLRWEKMAKKGRDCFKAIPKPNQNDYMGRLDYTVKIDNCIRVSKLFGTPK